VKENGFSLINGEDPQILRLRHRYRGRPFYFALDKNNEIVQQHIRDGGNVIYVDGGVIQIHERKFELPVIEINSIPACFTGAARFNVANAVVAIAAAYCAGIKISDIRAGMKTFQTNFYLSPGRLNFLELNGFSVLLDYAHNTPALRALAELIENLAASRAIGVLAIPGDRRNVDIHAFAQIAAKIFARIIIKEDADRRGRAPGEVARILKDGFLSCGRSEEDLEIVLDELDAVDCALRSAERGDLVVIFCEEISAVWNAVNAFAETVRADVQEVSR
jgi:cyanophycin synthetase